MICIDSVAMLRTVRERHDDHDKMDMQRLSFNADQHMTELTFACMKQAYDLGINFFDTAER